MTSSDSELKMILGELDQLSQEMQELLHKKKIMCIIQELRNRAKPEQTEEAASHQHEMDHIDMKLTQLTEKKFELQKRHDILKEVESNSSQNTMPNEPSLNVLHVEASGPPTYPAPNMILDVDNLPPHPCRTQCPECKQFIMTETFTSVSSVTWLVCAMTALIGCVAGCCLIPFCLDTFKSTTHRCPMCRTLIKTVKKL